MTPDQKTNGETLQSEAIVQPVAYKTLMDMHAKFKSQTHKHLTFHKRKEETRSIWFENNDYLKKFLTDILDPNNNISGIRVYICEYDETTIPEEIKNDPEKAPKYINKLTVGFVATTRNSSSGRHDDDRGTIKNKILNVDPYNHGKICPPDICPEEEEGDGGGGIKKN